MFIYFFSRIVLELFGLIALFGPARLALFCREADEDGSRSQRRFAPCCESLEMWPGCLVLHGLPTEVALSLVVDIASDARG
jgi:hypothetical protein